MPTEAELDQGGATPVEETPTPALTVPPHEILARARHQLETALADDRIPPGSIPNILSSLAKVAIASAELDREPAAPEVVFVDPHDDQWHDVHLVLTRSLTRIMELHQEAEAVLGKLDEQLSQFDHAVAIRTRQTIRLATRHYHTAKAETARKALLAASCPQP